MEPRFAKGAPTTKDIEIVSLSNAFALGFDGFGLLLKGKLSGRHLAQHNPWLVRDFKE
jgi:hypothetical protein